MRVTLSERASKQLRKSPENIRKKFIKQISLLQTNPRHPSLRARKLEGIDAYEARIDYHYRFCYLVEGDEVLIISVGPHDQGLGKK